MYVSVKGGERAIAAAHELLAEERRGDPAVPELDLAQIAQQLSLGVARVMAEGALYDPSDGDIDPAQLTQALAKGARDLGATIVRLLRHEGRTLYISGLDAVDGTPVLDIKPVMREFLPREPVNQPAWVSELMAQYW